MLRRTSIDNVVYWGTFLFAAIATGYILVTLINLSAQEDTAYLGTTNYREQIRSVTVVTSSGSFQIAFMRSQAPATTKNFLKLAQSGFYDEMKFYHFPEGVFIESGLAPDLSPQEGSANYVFEDHVDVRQVTRSLVAMPRRGGAKIDPRLLLFFAEDEQPVTSGAYAAFGRILGGMDVVDKIRGISPNINSGITPPVTLISITTD